MAIYHGIDGADVPFTAATNLSGFQYHFVTAGSVNGEVILANGASNPTAIGVLQNSPSATEEAAVRLFGPSKVYIVTTGTCGIAFGRGFTVNASGQGTDNQGETCPVNGMNLGKDVAVSTSAFIHAFLYGPLAASGLAAS